MRDPEIGEGRGEAADERADELNRPARGNPPSEGADVSEDGPFGAAGGTPAGAADYKIQVSEEERRRIEAAPPAALRGREEEPGGERG